MARIASDETKKIARERWEEWCDTFTNGNAGRPIGIEIVGSVAGDQTLAENVAFVAIDFDPEGKGNDFVISYGAEEAPTRHVVEAPTVLWQGQDVNGRVLALEIEDEGGGHTIITLGS
jgi:hypothetical protein